MSARAVTTTKEAATEFIPWEDRASGGGARFWRSWIMLMTGPSSFFRRMGLRGGMGEPVAFQAWCMACAFALTVIQALLWYLLGGSHKWLAWFPGSDTTLAFIFNMVCVFVLLTPVFALAMGLVSLIVGSLARLVVGGGPHGAGVEAYFSVFAYAMGPFILAVVPVVGWAVGAILWLVFAVLGMRSALGHRTGGALAAVFVPLLICGIVVGALLLLVPHHQAAAAAPPPPSYMMPPEFGE